MPNAHLLKDLSAPTLISGAPFGYDLLALQEALEEKSGIALYVARDDKTAATALKLAEFNRPAMDRVLLPGWDILPYDRMSPSPAVASQRCAALARMAQAGHDGKPLLVVTTGSSLVQRVPPRETMRTASFSMAVGEQVDEKALTDYLNINGYVRTSTVREKGDYSIRGGIIDIFPPTSVEPVRLDLFGDTLDQLKAFDPETQISSRSLTSATLAPVSEVLFSDETLSLFRERYLAQLGTPAGDTMYEAARAQIRRQGLENWLPLFHPHLETLFDYIGDDALLAFGSLASEAAAERRSQAEDYHTARLQAATEDRPARVLEPDALYLSPGEMDNALAHRGVARFQPSPGEGGVDLGARPGRDFAPERARPDINVFEEAAAHARALRESGRTVVLGAWTTGSADRLVNVMEDHGLGTLPRTYSLEAAEQAGLSICELPLEQGIEADDLAIIAEPDMLGDRLAAPRRKRKAANFIAEASALNTGDLVVHVDHGVGRYEGLKTLELTGAPHDCLELSYSGGDRIYLPVENIDLISRYGSEDAEGAIDKLGGVSWQTRKARAKKRILEMAAELLDIAAERELKKADPTTTGQGLYEEFAARFPYEETDDQLNAIEDTLSDLASGKPMDRLVCGDVGFGKTEVALRAAFVAAMSGMQVAVIAPTTLLARQHFNSFAERFANWPVKVKHLSRMVSQGDAAKTRDGLISGDVDIVVGTHALLSKSIEFKRLGLLIVDEEQRFGVKHKERLKELKADVHVLTLSATPIPRTLQMALTGIRDLSIIATPPVDRLSVRTYVTEFDTVTLREALLREKYRGGQAFFVAPRISDLDGLEAFMRDNVPEVSFVVAHGQMPANELEDIMTAFYEGQYDVLLSTTIVESGLDIPRANTLIIYRADRFGLAQLYQLRGRVGRSKLRAYAYMTTPRDQVMTPGAERRLRILQSLDSLGAGFQLASHDLDMRGSGNLLGDQQSGHVREVGVELYQSMLEDAVNALKSGLTDGDEDVADDWSPQINLGVAVLIPEDYVEDLSVRLGLYRRLADIDTEEGREGFAAELIDRFGPMPEETRQLMDITAIKAACKELGIGKLDAGPKGIIMVFRDDTPVDPGQLMALVRSRPNMFRLRPDSKLVINQSPDNRAKRIQLVRNVLKELANLSVPA
ncbi:transcription-repair coupling factor [Henriciella aquimarina]|uniref:transcription-repair coupling factor n=1 Tax=Henriciella aquimarina TaxID=545261 RepID=UPI000A02C8AE|nr:transcription-repair coupling factor [Henriciella aquimarina]